MAKKNKLLLAVISVVILLLSGVAALLLLNPKVEDTPDIYVPIINRAESEISKIEILNPFAKYEIVQAEDGTFKVPSMDGVAMSEEDLKNAVTYTASMKADKLIAENFDNGDLYNLDKLYAFSTVTFTDGTQTVIRIYEQLENDNGYYFTVDGSNNVYYMASSNPVKYFISPQTVLADRSFSPYSSYDTLDAFELVEITNKNGTFTIKGLETNGRDGYGNMYHYRVSGDADGFLVSRFFYDYMPDLRDFTSSSAFILFPTDAQLKELGLDKPQSKLRMVNKDGEEVTLLIGNNDNSAYHIMVEGNPVVYRMVNNAVTWLDYDANDILTPYLAAPNMYDTKSVTLSIDGETYVFVFDAENETAACNGKEIDYLNFKYMYKLLCSTIKGDAYTGSKPTKFDATILFDTNDGDIEVGLTLNERLVAITVNGKCQYACRKAYLDALKLGIDNLLAEKEVVFKW